MHTAPSAWQRSLAPSDGLVISMIFIAIPHLRVQGWVAQDETSTVRYHRPPVHVPYSILQYLMSDKSLYLLEYLYEACRDSVYMPCSSYWL